MDTTWRVLPYYVTSILMCSVCNVGIPIAFSFGKGETASLYEMFFTAFRKKFDIDLSKYIVESDHGTALTTVCNNHKCKHLGCLKHFLTSLGLNEYSKQVGELVSAKCIKDFETLKKIYSVQFSKITTQESYQQMMKTLEKAGLTYSAEERQIKIANKDKWDMISQIERIKYAMPSTTNALESTHGHLNAEIPRRNNFWSAMMRLVKYVLTKENNFTKAFKANYQREKRIVIKKCRENSSLMTKQKEFYLTDVDACQCGETKLISKMMRVEVPCSHIFSITGKFEELPENIKLIISKDGHGLCLKCELIEIPDTLADSDIEKRLQNKAVKTIRRYSHFKQDKVLPEEVAGLQVNDEFANGVPTSYHEAVAAGISRHFVRKNKGADAIITPSVDGLSK